jgi:hypothetical protein
MGSVSSFGLGAKRRGVPHSGCFGKRELVDSKCWEIKKRAKRPQEYGGKGFNLSRE